jgi:aspartyl-tRNA(Asn)/glutamyl-tRNA(Gln) amidotransferase subunit B
LELDDAFLEECRASLPELPDAKRHRYENALGLSPYNAGVLTADADTARWFEALIAASAAKQGKAEGDVAKAAANWLLSELFGALNRLGKTLETSPVNPEQGAELLALVADGTISGTIAKQVFEIMLDSGGNAAQIVEERGSSRRLIQARSRRRWPKCLPTMPTRSSSTRRARKRCSASSSARR